MRTRPRPAALIASAAIVLALAGCGVPAPTYVSDGGSYTAEEVLRLPSKLEPGDLADEAAERSAELRHEALVKLRRQGPDAAEVASLITRTFPADTLGVPFYVERATFDGGPAIVIVEAIGRPGGSLSDERVWVISDSGDVLISGTR
jgi:hypothetical protein